MTETRREGSTDCFSEEPKYTPTEAQRMVVRHLVNKHTRRGIAETVGYSQGTVQRLAADGSTSVAVWDTFCDVFPVLRKAGEGTIETAIEKVLEEADSDYRLLLKEAMRLADVPVGDVE